MLFDDENKLKDLLGKFNILQESAEKGENELDVILDDIFDFMYDESYTEFMKGFFYEKTLIIDMLNFFVKKNYSDKIKNLVFMLDKYYNVSIEDIYKIYLKDENYEFCTVVRNSLNS